MHRTDKDTWPIKLEIGSSRTKSLEKKVQEQKKISSRVSSADSLKGLLHGYMIYIYMFPPTSPVKVVLQAPLISQDVRPGSWNADLQGPFLHCKGHPKREKLDTWGGVKFVQKERQLFFLGGKMFFLANIAKVKRSRRLFLFECLKCIPVLLLTQLSLGNSFFDSVESFTFWRHFLIESSQTCGKLSCQSSRLSDTAVLTMRSLVVHVSASCHRWDDWLTTKVNGLADGWCPFHLVTSMVFSRIFLCVFLKWRLSDTWWVGKIFTSCAGYWMHSTLLVVNIVTSHSTPSRHFTGGSCVACTFGGRYFEDFHLDGNGFLAFEFGPTRRDFFNDVFQQKRQLGQHGSTACIQCGAVYTLDNLCWDRILAPKKPTELMDTSSSLPCHMNWLLFWPSQLCKSTPSQPILRGFFCLEKK